jgi:hypothetical protein
MTRLVFAFFVLASALIPSMARAQIVSDEFTGTLNAAWRFTDPRGGCTQTTTATQASIAAPIGLNRDALSTTGNRSPRLIHKVAEPGADIGNFAVQIKIDSPLNQKFQFAGISANENHNKFIRCELYSTTTPNTVIAFMWAIGGSNSQSSSPVATLFNVSPLYLRLDRVGTTFTLRYGTDGTNWTIGAQLASELYSIDSLGVYAGGTDADEGTPGGPPPCPCPPPNTAPAYTGLFDYFHSVTILPVQLSSFVATQQAGNTVRLDWTTATETNNYGFEVQKSLGDALHFETIAGSFIPGHGTTTEPRSYSFIDRSVSQGQWYYRLKQIDLDGTIHYTEPIVVTVLTAVDDQSLPVEFDLKQNYPNPFNPSTKIKFSIPSVGAEPARTASAGGHVQPVQLKVYDVLGREVATLVNEALPAGSYERTFDASQLTSGVYIYKLTAGDQSFTRKMTLTK